MFELTRRWTILGISVAVVAAAALGTHFLVAARAGGVDPAYLALGVTPEQLGTAGISIASAANGTQPVLSLAAAEQQAEAAWPGAGYRPGVLVDFSQPSAPPGPIVDQLCWAFSDPDAAIPPGGVPGGSPPPPATYFVVFINASSGVTESIVSGN